MESMQLRRYVREFNECGGPAVGNRVFSTALESTNVLAKQIATDYLDEKGPPTTLVVALEQTSGRGRLGRMWLSPPGGIYLSLVFALERREHLQSLPMLVGIAACREICRLVPAECRLKWPNDLMVEGRKIGGILIESMSRGATVAAVVGVGVNHSTALAKLAPGATTILEEAGRVEPLPRVAARLATAVERQLDGIDRVDNLAKQFENWSAHRPGETVRCRTAAGLTCGRFAGFDERGFLRLLTTEGERRLASGEMIETAEAGHG